MNLTIDGIALDIAENPTGGTALEAAREIIDDYELHNLDLRPGGVVLDIGANVGVVSLYLAKKYPGIIVYAYEPARQTYRYLERNILTNDVATITPVNKGVAGSKGRRMLFGDVSINSGGVSLESGQPYLETCETVTLADVFQTHQIDRVALLKLDCEFAEYDIILNSTQLLNRVDRVRGEFHQHHHGNPPDTRHYETLLRNHIRDVGIQTRVLT